MCHRNMALLAASGRHIPLTLTLNLSAKQRQYFTLPKIYWNLFHKGKIESFCCVCKNSILAMTTGQRIA